MQAKPPIAGGGISGAVVDLVGADRGKKNAPPNWQGRTGRILRGGGLRSPSCAVTAARYEGPRGGSHGPISNRGGALAKVPSGSIMNPRHGSKCPQARATTLSIGATVPYKCGRWQSQWRAATRPSCQLILRLNMTRWPSARRSRLMAKSRDRMASRRKCGAVSIAGGTSDWMASGKRKPPAPGGGPESARGSRGSGKGETIILAVALGSGVT
jgi:hypothetical protein